MTHQRRANDYGNTAIDAIEKKSFSFIFLEFRNNVFANPRRQVKSQRNTSWHNSPRKGQEGERVSAYRFFTFRGSHVRQGSRSCKHRECC